MPPADGGAILEWVPEGQLHVRVVSWPDPGRILLSGELDLVTSPQLEVLLNSAADLGVSRLEIDCRGLRFVDSTGLRVLIRPMGGRSPIQIVLENRTDSLSRIIDLTGLSDHFEGT